MPTNIQVEDDTWRKLNAEKLPGDTFDDVVNRMFERCDSEGRKQ